MKKLQPHQQRVVEEATVLSDNLVRLLQFIESSSVYQNLETTEQTLLRAQSGAMRAYLEVLNLRIETFYLPVNTGNLMKTANEFDGF